MLGDQTATAVNGLSTGFADATRWALLVATGLLILELFGALRLRRTEPVAASGAHASGDEGT